jgi:hypothetical protein
MKIVADVFVPIIEIVINLYTYIYIVVRRRINVHSKRL